MFKRTILLALTIPLTLSSPVRADLWGGDVIVLSQILTQTIEQLAQLREIVSSAQNEIEIMKNINEGLDDALLSLKEISPELDPGMFKDWRSVSRAMNGIEKIYGTSLNVKDSDLYKLNDTAVAEAVVLNNRLFKNAEEGDKIGRQIRQQVQHASPKGAQKITAQSLGYLLEVQSNSLRAQAKSIKLQAQSLARVNKIDKERSKIIQNTVSEINEAFSKQAKKEKFKIPRFK